jgi:segregation and condensation protein A
MTAKQSRRGGGKASEEFDEDLDATELVDTSITLENPEDFVDLIDQPAWKTILISVVKREKMDPWNIDIKILAQKYLEKIRSLQSTDLRLPANAILASTILLKFKARALKLPSMDEEGNFRDLMTEEKLLGGIMPELINPTLVREGKVTLDELVESIENILDKTKTKLQRMRDTKERPVFSLPIATLNIEGKMKELLELVNEHADHLGLARFSQLVENRSANEIVDSFIALLFLINKRKLNAWQEDLFGEIMISLVTEEELEKEKEEEGESEEKE